MSAAELARLGQAFEEAARTGKLPIGIAALRVLALTGCRKGEILNLRWEEVDFENACLRLPDSKTGRKVVPLGAAALAVLNDVPRFESNPFVLAGEHTGTRYGGVERLWRWTRDRAGLPGVRIHDLRHSYAAMGAASGDSLLVIGAILGHANASTTKRYAHLTDHPVKAAADRIAGAINAALTSRPAAGDVVPLGRRGSR